MILKDLEVLMLNVKKSPCGYETLRQQDVAHWSTSPLAEIGGTNLAKEMDLLKTLEHHSNG